MIGKVQLACCVVSFVSNLALLYPAPAESDPDKDSRLRELVAESEQLATAKKSSAAIEKCDKVIAAFKGYYGKQRRKIYCGNSSAEVLGNLLQAAVKNENAIVLSPTWANAYFVKGYALQDLHRTPEAKTTTTSRAPVGAWVTCTLNLGK